jgi:hypothetical protein
MGHSNLKYVFIVISMCLSTTRAHEMYVTIIVPVYVFVIDWSNVVKSQDIRHPHSFLRSALASNSTETNVNLYNHMSQEYQVCLFVGLMMINATFNNISVFVVLFVCHN